MTREHRKPPLRPSLYTQLPWGTCRWCAGPILKIDGSQDRRRRWHRECLDEYFGLTDQVTIRNNVNDRDMGRCADCGEFFGFWDSYGEIDGQCPVGWLPEAWGRFIRVNYLVRGIEVDHIVPLWLSAGLGAEARLQFFLMANLQSLCGPCHKAKSAAEARERSQA